ncbi:MAG: hypothetical protein KDC98_15610 [Planctomycetes bacterium]|nr:hypothetical protein [Planctomycetota bacterium]
MTNDPNPSLPDPTPTPAAANADLDRVREILFGDRSRQIADRIAALEARIEQQDRDLRELIAATANRNEAACADLGVGLDGLRAAKLDRDALAGLLAGIVDQLGKIDGNPE